MALATATCLALIAGASVGTAGPNGKSKKAFSKEERAVVSAAKAKGEKVTLLFAATPGAADQLSAALKGLGAEIGYEHDGISYVRATLAAGQVDAAAALEGVEAVDVDTIIPLEDPRPEGVQPVAPQPAPTAATPRVNPYMPTGDTGAAQWVNANPTLDGRGIKVGILDSGIDLDHPSLNVTSTGERKIVDWVTYTHPTGDQDPTWVNMGTTVNGPSFTAFGVTYTAPGAGPYQFGRFNERSAFLGGEVGSDVNRDGNPPGSNGLFPVLWDKATNQVWVDTNQNNSFADQTAMTDYKVNFDVGTFGTDNPATAIREAMPFVVQTASSATGVVNRLNIGIVSAAHGSHVAGIVAGNKLFGGSMSGAAPGAKLVSVRVCLFVAGCTSHALIEGMIYAIEKADVDVVNMSIGGLPALNDANNARAVLYDRLIEDNGVQMFISAGNSGAGLNTIGDPSVASKVMSIGSSITDATWRSNYGSDSAFADNLHPFSSRGPTESGAFKPQITAPGSAVSTVPTWQPGQPLVGTYALPPGYGMFNGTSMASPQSAGAAALLLGAAKASGLTVTPAQLRQAFNSTARYFPRYKASDQGNGLLRLDAAWQMVKAGIKPVTITSAVPVNTLLSGFLATPGVGEGIYDREGVVAGQKYDRDITFTRTSGPSGSVLYKLSWVGNDGTFQSSSALPLKLNVPNSLKVKVQPGSSGLHSAILNVDDPNTPGVDYQTMNTVVASETLTAANGFAVTKSGTIGRNQTESFFFAVPTGAPAFKVDITGGGAAPGAGQIRFLRFHPYGVGWETNATNNCYNPSAGTCNGSESPTSRTVSNPQPGVWEVVVEARRTSDTASAPYTLTASILGVAITPSAWTIDPAKIGTTYTQLFSFTNNFGGFTGNASGTALGSAFAARPTIANAAVQTYTVAVPAGSTSLTAKIGNTSDTAADLDLFVLRPDGTTAGQSADGDSEEAVTIANPVAGNWTVVVDGFAVPAGTTAYDYLDVFAHSSFGSVTITDPAALHPSGSTWSATASTTPLAAPAAGRFLQGFVNVKNTDGSTLGSAEVKLKNVAP